MMKFYKQLKEYCMIPSPSRNEKEIARLLRKRFLGLSCKNYQDKKGNLYFLRKGQKDGLVMLCAHQDKVLNSNVIGTLKKTTGGDYMPVLTSLENKNGKLERLLQWPLYAIDGKSIIPVDVESVDGDLKIERRKKITLMDLIGFLGKGLSISPIPFRRFDIEYLVQNVIVRPKRKLTGLFAPKLIAWPDFVEDETAIYGKLDDAMGLALIDDVFMKTNPEESPSLLATFTTMEEIGCKGSKYSVDVIKALKLDEIIVLDTTPLIKPGQGFALYEKCGNLSFDFFEGTEDTEKKEMDEKEPLVEKIEETAKQGNFKINTVPAFINDANVFASETNIPTVALEPPVLGLHSACEVALKSDIEELRNFLYYYIENFRPL